MRNPIWFSLAALTLTLGSGAASADADADADGPDFYQVTGVTENDTLNIRAEPDPHAAKVGEIPHDGTCIRNLGCKGGLTFQEFTQFSPAEQARRLKNPHWCKMEYQDSRAGLPGATCGRAPAADKPDELRRAPFAFEVVKVPAALLEHLTEALCYAA